MYQRSDFAPLSSRYRRLLQFLADRAACVAWESAAEPRERDLETLYAPMLTRGLVRSCVEEMGGEGAAYVTVTPAGLLCLEHGIVPRVPIPGADQTALVAIIEGDRDRGGRVTERDRKEFMLLSGRKFRDIAKRAPAWMMTFDLEAFRGWLQRVAFGEMVWTCSYCGRHLVLKDVEPDHLAPLSKGGTQTLDNLTPACKPCNQEKGELTHSDYLQFKAKLAEMPLAAQSYIRQALKLAGYGRRMQVVERKRRAGQRR